MTPRAMSGRAAEELTVDEVRDGAISTDDIRISPETLRHQAEQAEQFGNPQLADNLRRGAEMTGLDDDELMRMYDALRPGRSTLAELRSLTDELRERGLPRCAALVGEAADVYERRGLTS